MSKKEKKNALLDAITELESQNKVKNENVGVSDNIVDIETFCEDEEFLNLPGNNLNLFIGQKVILKSFYLGSIGNEKLKLTEEEWQWLYDKQDDLVLDGFTYHRNLKDVIKKIHGKEKTSSYSPFTELVLVLGRRGSKCRNEQDLIATTEGSLTFRELCDRLNNNEKIGICTYDPKTWKRSVTYNIKAKDNGIVNCYKITTSRGVEEISSWNHPYLIWRDDFDEPKFVYLKDIKAGDKIAVAEKTELFGKGSIGINKAALLGHFQGDGSIIYEIGYSTSCPKMLNDFESLIKKEFKGHIVKHKSNYDYTVIKKTGYFKMNGSRKNMVKEWLIKEGVYGKKAINKRVPKSILIGSKEEVAAFLSRLFGCDGYGSVDKYLDKHHKTNKSLIGIGLSSKQFITDIGHLLLKFGIHSVISYNPVKYNGEIKDSWCLKITKIDSINIFKNEINIFSKEEKTKEVYEKSLLKTKSKSSFDNIPKGVWNRIEKISKDNGLSISNVATTKEGRLRREYTANRDKINCIGEEYKDEFLIDTANSDIKWDEVKSVEFCGEKNTVDLQVDPHHIIGGDIISHNTLISSVITAYEAYKLLVINNGNPHKYYNLPSDDEIAIINVALAQKQAGRLFYQIQSRLRNSKFFHGRIAKETSDSIRLYTDEDLRKKKEGANLNIQGSILLLCGHSNPDSLAGYNAILLLFDEIAFYDETGKITGKYFVSRLKPSLSKFYKYKAGKIVMISSPNAKSGAFYEEFKNSESSDKEISDSILSYQLPSWDVNDDVEYSDPELKKDRKNNFDMFAVEFGGQWAQAGQYGNYFEEEAVNRCIRYDLEPHIKPLPGFNYYMHVDPAKKNNNYAAVLVGKRKYTNTQGEKRHRCHLAGVWVWKPTPNLGLEFESIDKEVIRICSIFHPISVTYDDYQSVHSVQRLRNHGINCTQVPYNNTVKCKFYLNVRNMMLYQPEPEIYLYNVCENSALLIDEMKNIKYRQRRRGITLLPDSNADVNTDDLLDCFAGAVSAASNGLRMELPPLATIRSIFF